MSLLRSKCPKYGGGPIPFALASHVASCLDSPGISWLHVVSPTPLLGFFFFF